MSSAWSSERAASSFCGTEYSSDLPFLPSLPGPRARESPRSCRKSARKRPFGSPKLRSCSTCSIAWTCQINMPPRRSIAFDSAAAAAARSCSRARRSRWALLRRAADCSCMAAIVAAASASSRDAPCCTLLRRTIGTGGGGGILSLLGGSR